MWFKFPDPPVPTVYAIVHCILSIDLLSLPNSSMHLVPGRVLRTLQIGTKFNRSSTRVKEMGTVHPDLPDFNNLCTSMKVDLFNKVLKIPIHVLHPLLPPPSVIHSDMVYDPEYMTKLYQREAQTLWIVTSSSECYI